MSLFELFFTFRCEQLSGNYLIYRWQNPALQARATQFDVMPSPESFRPVLDTRGRLLNAALGVAGLPRFSYDHSVGRYGPGSTCGRIGRLAAGMHRLGYDLPLTQYDERGWRAAFYTSG